MLTGILALIAGVAVTLAVDPDSSAAAFFVGTAIAGVGFGSGFQGGIRTVVPLAEPHERSGVLSAALRRLVPGHGRARRVGRVPRGARRRPDRDRPGVRRRRDRRWPRSRCCGLLRGGRAPPGSRHRGGSA